jgi:hypothetical protein
MNQKINREKSREMFRNLEASKGWVRLARRTDGKAIRCLDHCPAVLHTDNCDGGTSVLQLAPSAQSADRAVTDMIIDDSRSAPGIFGELQLWLTPRSQRSVTLNRGRPVAPAAPTN